MSRWESPNFTGDNQVLYEYCRDILLPTWLMPDAHGRFGKYIEVFNMLGEYKDVRLSIMGTIVDSEFIYFRNNATKNFYQQRESVFGRGNITYSEQESCFLELQEVMPDTVKDYLQDYFKAKEWGDLSPAAFQRSLRSEGGSVTYLGDYLASVSLGFSPEVSKLALFKLLHGLVIRGADLSSWWNVSHIRNNWREDNVASLVGLLADEQHLSVDERQLVGNMVLKSLAVSGEVYSFEQLGVVLTQLKGLVEINKLNWEGWTLNNQSLSRCLDGVDANYQLGVKAEWQRFHEIYKRLADFGDVLGNEGKRLTEKALSRLPFLHTVAWRTLLGIEIVKAFMPKDLQTASIHNLIESLWANRGEVLIPGESRQLLWKLAREAGLYELAEGIEAGTFNDAVISKTFSVYRQEIARLEQDKLNEKARQILARKKPQE